MSAPSSVIAFGLAVFGLAASSQAQSFREDPLSQGRVLELSFGLFAPQNTLQDALTVLNGNGPMVQTTDQLDFGAGGRFGLSYSQPWGNSRLLIDLTGTQAKGETTISIGGVAEAYPGSYDDGFNLPAGYESDIDTKTDLALLSIGREWQLAGNWTLSAGLQGGKVSQDLSAIVYNDDPAAYLRRQTTQSENRMLGVFGGVGHYIGFSDTMGLRLSASLGVMGNKFEYSYINSSASGTVDQDVEASSSGTAVSTKLSARLERSMSGNGVVSLETGYEGLQGIGNGFDTFLDRRGTADTAQVDADRIGGVYVNLGYAFRF